MASDVPPLNEVVADRTTGTMVRASDPAALTAALRTLVADPFRTEAWGAVGHDRATRRFSWDVFVAGHEKTCEVALAGG